jgi:hypothetical protein
MEEIQYSILLHQLVVEQEEQKMVQELPVVLVVVAEEIKPPQAEQLLLQQVQFRVMLVGMDMTQLPKVVVAVEEQEVVAHKEFQAVLVLVVLGPSMLIVLVQIFIMLVVVVVDIMQEAPEEVLVDV